MEFVVCRLAGENFGLAVERVREVVNTPALTPLPQINRHVEGVINLRGNIVPVINLARKLGLPGGNVRDFPCIAVVEWQNESVGLLVEEVDSVQPLTPEPIENKQLGWVDADRFVVGMGRLAGGGLALLLDLDAVLERGEGGESAA